MVFEDLFALIGNSVLFLLFVVMCDVQNQKKKPDCEECGKDGKGESKCLECWKVLCDDCRERNAGLYMFTNMGDRMGARDDGAGFKYYHETAGTSPVRFLALDISRFHVIVRCTRFIGEHDEDAHDVRYNDDWDDDEWEEAGKAIGKC